LNRRSIAPVKDEAQSEYESNQRFDFSFLRKRWYCPFEVMANNFSRSGNGAVELDQISWKIVEELQEDARLSWAELGRRVGLATPAVADRVHRLEVLGVIRGFHAEVYPKKLGVPMLVFVRLTVSGGENEIRRFLPASGRWDEVVECHRVTGSESFILKARVTSVEHLECFIDKLGRFGATATSTVLSSSVSRRAITRKAVEQSQSDLGAGKR
jgi:Lrp/AsnC family transcriptional regulator, leucine-responsive regulatory protein